MWQKHVILSLHASRSEPLLQRLRRILPHRVLDVAPVLSSVDGYTAERSARVGIVDVGGHRGRRDLAWWVVVVGRTGSYT